MTQKSAESLSFLPMRELGDFSSIDIKSAVGSPSAARPAREPQPKSATCLMSSARLIPARRGSCPRIPRVDCCPARWRVPFRTPTGLPKHPRALPQRDSGIDGSFPLPVAAVEARRSRSLSVADDVALMEGWVGKEGGAESLSVPSPGILCGFPSAISRTNLWRRLVIS
jgi:hypothetical protein